MAAHSFAAMAAHTLVELIIAALQCARVEGDASLAAVAAHALADRAARTLVLSVSSLQGSVIASRVTLCPQLVAAHSMVARAARTLVELAFAARQHARVGRK